MSAADPVFVFSRIADGVVFDLFAELSSFGVDDPTFQLSETTKFKAPNGRRSEEWADAIKDSGYLLYGALAEIAGARIHYRRGRHYARDGHGNYGWLRTDNPFTDCIRIEVLEVAEHFPNALEIIQSRIDMSPPVMADEATAAAAAHSKAIIARISDAAATLAEHTAARQKALDDYREELTRSAEAALAARRLELDQEAADQRKANADSLANEEADLKLRAEDIEKRRKRLDDRENMHVRRELQANMARLSAEGLEVALLGKSKSALNFTIGLATAAALLLFLIILAEIRYAWSTELVVQLRLAAQAAGLGLLVWFVLGQATARYQQVIRWEKDLHRFRLDAERASFLIEGDLEARKVNGQGLPEVMLDRFSRGLFGSDAHEPAGDEIGSTLGHLLGRAASLKIGTDGVEVGVDRAGLKKARKDIARDDDSSAD